MAYGHGGYLEAMDAKYVLAVVALVLAIVVMLRYLGVL